MWLNSRTKGFIKVKQHIHRWMFCTIKENRKEHKLLFKQKINKAASLSPNLQEHRYKKPSLSDNLLKT